MLWSTAIVGFELTTYLVVFVIVIVIHLYLNREFTQLMLIYSGALITTYKNNAYIYSYNTNIHKLPWLKYKYLNADNVAVSTALKGKLFHSNSLIIESLGCVFSARFYIILQYFWLFRS